MSSEWHQIRLGDYITSSLGKMLDQKKNKGVPQPYLGNSNVRWGFFDLSDLAMMPFEERETERYEICHGDLIICEGGEPGRCAVWENQAQHMKIQKALHRVRTKSGLNTYFLYYWFLWAGKAGALEPYFTGTTIKHLTGKALVELKLSVPSVATQDKTAKILKSLDDKIALNTQINQTLESMAQALFKSWFVDFDPVKAKIAVLESGGTLDTAELAAMSVISGKDSSALAEMQTANPEAYEQLKATAALFPGKMVESELGMIPEGWEVKPLIQLVKLIGGGTPKRSEESFWGGDIPWFSVKDIPAEGNVFVIDTDEKITAQGLAKSSTKILEVGTTIITARGTVGKIALVGVPMAMNQSCYGVKGIEGIEPYFNYFNLRNCVANLQQNTHGAVFDTITQSTFESVFSVIPNEFTILKEFDRTIAPSLELIKNNVVENTSLAATRDTLLPKLLSGEIDLSSFGSFGEDN